MSSVTDREAALEKFAHDAIPFMMTTFADREFVHEQARRNRDAVLWAYADLFPGKIRTEGIETPRAIAASRGGA